MAFEISSVIQFHAKSNMKEKLSIVHLTILIIISKNWKLAVIWCELERGRERVEEWKNDKLRSRRVTIKTSSGECKKIISINIRVRERERGMLNKRRLWQIFSSSHSLILFTLLYTFHLSPPNNDDETVIWW